MIFNRFFSYNKEIYMLMIWEWMGVDGSGWEYMSVWVYGCMGV